MVRLSGLQLASKEGSGTSNNGGLLSKDEQSVDFTVRRMSVCDAHAQLARGVRISFHMAVL